MTIQLKIERPFHVARRHRGSKRICEKAAPEIREGRIPRIARLMALAVHCEQLIRDGVVADQTELSRQGHISKSRMTQIMALLNLATDIQEEVLFLPRTKNGRDAIKERDLRRIAAIIDWDEQRKQWTRSHEKTRIPRDNHER